MKNFYPPDYYSFRKVKHHGHSNFAKVALEKKRDQYALFKKGFTGRLIKAVVAADSICSLMGNAQVRPDSRVLDVGCGAGALLDFLQDRGFTDLTGIDPYAQKYLGSGVKILNKAIEDLGDDKFDVIIFRDSLEHILDQFAALRKTSALLNKNGVCLVRMPLKTEYIWDRYGTNWVQIDAPRHCVIHTIKSFDLLLKKNRFEYRRCNI
ncbi:MAG: class I SAM-dependent methyltransferase [Halobacteriota archaeon]